MMKSQKESKRKQVFPSSGRNRRHDTQHNGSIAMLSVIYAECRKYALYAECHFAACRYAECHYAECQYAECQ